ncbi:uncharacterized protein LOC121596562 [Anopheles merus]|uniref:uncharacterized protein LOC121596562 n=1 Tax=Anopheles merus TaxID=30066 RepID=UPI001BE48983|nr:uncharacterized protein LOC121596562 [Anopheles merus]
MKTVIILSGLLVAANAIPLTSHDRVFREEIVLLKEPFHIPLLLINWLPHTIKPIKRSYNKPALRQDSSYLPWCSIMNDEECLLVPNFNAIKTKNHDHVLHKDIVLRKRRFQLNLMQQILESIRRSYNRPALRQDSSNLPWCSTMNDEECLLVPNFNAIKTKNHAITSKT